jgi:hypothetical protein
VLSRDENRQPPILRTISSTAPVPDKCRTKDVRPILSVETKLAGRKGLLVVLLIAPMISGCGASISDFSIKDQEWLARPGRMFGTKSLSLETPPLTPEKPVTPDDLVSAEGGCPGMASAMSPEGSAAEGAAVDGGPQPVGAVALGHTECDVVRSIGAPDSVNLSNNPRGDRVATITYLHGSRPGLYTFTAGRLTSVERVDVPPLARPARPAKKKRG